jgi:DNA-binding MarR family transcriptional regulator
MTASQETRRTASGPTDREALHVGAALARLAHAYGVQAKDVVADLPGGARGLHALNAVAAGTAGSQAALAQDLGVNRTTMTYLIDDLERAGLVQRRPDPQDRRNRQVVATDHGRRLLGELNRCIRQVEDQVFAGLSDQEQETLAGLLRKAAAHGSTTNASDAPC